MKRLDQARADAALAPVRAALLRQAHADADRLGAEAGQRAEAEIVAAKERAEALLARAAADAKADAERSLADTRTRIRHASRSARLAAQRDAYEEFHRRLRTAVVDLRRASDYPWVRERLAARIERALGPDAAVAEAPEGGLIGETAGRRVDLSLGRVGESAADAAGADVEELWSP